MEIRDASAEDAPSACAVLRRSIMELCAADHRDDPAILAKWLANKTLDHFRSWIRPGNSVLVAVEGGAILAIGAVTDADSISLNYISPDARFQGVSRAMLTELERRALERGSLSCHLSSTLTARRFYRANGYLEDGGPISAFGIIGYPMRRWLTAKG